jgi:superoxide dismutase
MSRHLFGGRVIFEVGDGRTVKEVEVITLFKKVTAVREKLRVLEQKINNHGTLLSHEKAELQAYISRSFGSLTTFNFMFHRDQDKFRGTQS